MSNTNCFGFQASGGSGGGGATTGYIDIDYKTLITDILAGALVPGQKYRLIDYQSLNWLNGETVASNNPVPIDPSFNPQEIYSSNAEKLLLEAISTSAISPISYSEKFPQDIIEYLPITSSFGLENGLYIQNGQTLPNGFIVVGFDLLWDGSGGFAYFDMPLGYPAWLGQNFYLYMNFSAGAYFIDADYNPLVNGVCAPTFDYSGGSFTTTIQSVNGGAQIILNNVTFADYTNYDPNSLNVTTLEFFAPAYGKILRRNDTLQIVDVPFDFRNQVFRRYQINTAIGLVYGGIGDECIIAGTTYTTTGLFKDTLTFPGSAYNINWSFFGDNNVFYGCKNLNIGSSQDCSVLSEIGGEIGAIDNMLVYQIYLSSIVLGSSNLIELFSFNSFDQVGNNNLLGSITYNVSVGSFEENNLFNFSNNKIGNGFYQNTITQNCNNNTFGDSVYLNNISDNFNQNTVGNIFQGNGIGANCTLNNFGDSFNNNRNIKINFRRNNITSNVGFIDFATATFVYANYDCQIISMQNGASFIFWLAYTNYNAGIPLITYAAPNA